MGFINLEPTLHAGETIRWTRPAALLAEERVVRGMLFATSEGLIFMPNRLNRRRDLIAQRIRRDDLDTVAVLERERTLRGVVARSSAALGRRLVLRSRHGDALVFVVRHPDEVAAEIRALLGEA